MYIRDAQTNKYKKFSDIHVTAVPNEDVWKDSLGELKTRAAYCLYYVNDDIWQRMQNDTPMTHYIPKTIEDNKDSYNKLVPAPLAQEVLE